MLDKDKIDLSMFLDDYLNDAKEGFQRINSALLALEKDRSQTEQLDEIFRVVHTLKSSSTMLEFSDIAELAHLCEDLLAHLRKNELSVTQEIIDLLFEVVDMFEAMVKERVEGKSEPTGGWGLRIVELRKKLVAQKTDTESACHTPKSEVKAAIMPTIGKIQTVRVHVDLLDSLFDLAGELIITKNRIDNLVSELANKELKAALVAMDRMIKELQENVSAARLVPVDEIFQKFPRMVRDLARDAHKEVELVVEGREIELDKAVLDAISEPLIHLLRNAVDHGIEPADERQKRNKKRCGTIKLVAKRAENHILIGVEDDGGGIDMAQMKEVAVRKGFVTPEEAESLSDKGVFDLLFAPGFSSAKEVTSVSGRGIGLNVVRTSVKGLGGTVEVTTEKGQGTRFTLRLPLATAIMQTLMVGVGEHIFAIPSDIVLETLEPKTEDIREIRDQQVLVLRNEVIPFLKLNRVLNMPYQEGQKEMIGVIIHRGDKLVGLGVDAVLGQVENIIKPFDPIAQQFKGFSGGTILGDGRVVLLLDIPSLLGFETLPEERYST
jgi:two-component system chemotaxis sensor kinase CheA